MTQTESSFREELLVVLPRLRIYARSLTRDRTNAEDLVQDTIVKALAGRHTFTPGTNLVGWLFKIQRNAFLSWVRTQKNAVAREGAFSEKYTGSTYNMAQEDTLLLKELVVLIEKLSPTQRISLRLVIEGVDVETIAAMTGVSLGTVKARITRGRDNLLKLMQTSEMPLNTRGRGGRKNRTSYIR